MAYHTIQCVQVQYIRHNYGLFTTVQQDSFQNGFSCSIMGFGFTQNNGTSCVITPQTEDLAAFLAFSQTRDIHPLRPLQVVDHWSYKWQP